MLRAIFICISLPLYMLVAGPPLLLFTLISRNPNPLYWGGVKGILFLVRLVGVKVRTKGRERVPAGACLFVANHTSSADAPAVVGAIPRRIAILGRKSLFDIPVVGTAFRLAKFVPVDREDRDAALASVKQAVEYIREGFSFLVYPEGTRSPDGRLRRFKKGSFVIAIEAGIPIVPVACAGAHRIMRKNSLIVRPGKVTVRFGMPIDASAYTVEQRDELAQRVHDAVAAELPEDQRPAT